MAEKINNESAKEHVIYDKKFVAMLHAGGVGHNAINSLIVLTF